MTTIVECLRGRRHLASADTQGNCVLCGREKPTGGERFIAEFETEAVKKHGFELLGNLPGVELEQYLGEHEETLEVYLFATVRVKSGDEEEEERTLILDDAPIFFDPTWDEETLVFWVAEDLDLKRDEARARLQKCGLLLNAPTTEPTPHEQG